MQWPDFPNENARNALQEFKYNSTLSMPELTGDINPLKSDSAASLNAGLIHHLKTLMHPVLISIFLLLCSNVFMTFAWYAHLKELNNKPWLIAALISWGIALLEYLFQVPANRIGFTVLNVGQLKILQEVITLTIFVPFSVMYLKEPLKLDYLSVMYLKEPLKLDYLWAGLCLVGAVYFMFRSRFA